MKRILEAVTVSAILVSGAAMAGDNAAMGVAVHVVMHSPRRSCAGGLPAIRWCEDIVTTERSGDVDCFPVFYDLVEYVGCEYGLVWPGTHDCSFTSCTDLVIGDISRPGDGVSHTWTGCRREDVAIPGWAWIYEPYGALVCVVGHPVSGGIYVLDCADQVDTPDEDPTCAGIGGLQGDDPCKGGPPITRGKWGEIKSMFK